jgi:hypothetical protein
MCVREGAAEIEERRRKMCLCRRREKQQKQDVASRQNYGDLPPFYVEPNMSHADARYTEGDLKPMTEAFFEMLGNEIQYTRVK